MVTCTFSGKVYPQVSGPIGVEGAAPAATVALTILKAGRKQLLDELELLLEELLDDEELDELELLLDDELLLDEELELLLDELLDDELEELELLLDEELLDDDELELLLEDEELLLEELELTDEEQLLKGKAVSPVLDAPAMVIPNSTITRPI